MSYTAVGAALGTSGTWLGSNRIETPSSAIAYGLAAAIVILALVGDRGAFRIPFLQRAMQRTLGVAKSWPTELRALLLGVATPLLPCGLLWSMLAAAAISGSAAGGAMAMLGFALGSLPLLVLAQWRGPLLLRRLAPTTLATVQRTAMLAAAALLVWRGYQASHGGCCH